MHRHHNTAVGGGATGAGVHPGGEQKRIVPIRKTLDCYPTFITSLHQRLYQRDYRDQAALQPHSDYLRDVTPPSHNPHDPSLAFTTHFCHTSVSKQRCDVNCVAWTPEGRRIITGNSLGEFTLWDGGTFAFIKIVGVHEQEVRVMEWSGDDQWLVSADAMGVIRYFNPSLRDCKHFKAHQKPINSISFAPTDLKFLSCAEDGLVQVWDFETGQPDCSLGSGSAVRCAQWHPHKALIASTDNDRIRLWDPKSGKNINTLYGHHKYITKIEWNGNGNWLLTGSSDLTCKVFDIRKVSEASGEMHSVCGHKREISSIRWHPFYESAFVSGDQIGCMQYWLVTEQEPQATVQNAHDAEIKNMCYHPFGHVLSTGSKDCTVKHWCRPRPGDSSIALNGLHHHSRCYMASGRDGVLAVDDSAQEIPGLPGKDHPKAARDKQQREASSSLDAVLGNRLQPQSRAPGDILEMGKGKGGKGKLGKRDFNNMMGSFSRGTPPPGYRCKRCGVEGHFVQDCKNPQIGGKGNVPPSGYVCKKCNIPGHFIQDCPNEPSRRIPPEGYVCNKCHIAGHYIQDCEKRQY